MTPTYPGTIAQGGGAEPPRLASLVNAGVIGRAGIAALILGTARR